MSDLTILCVTKCEPYAEPFIRHMADVADQLDASFVLAVDGWPPYWLCEKSGNTPVIDLLIEVQSHGYIESVLDQAIDACPDGYILRLDDDEKASPELISFLDRMEYQEAPHWAFPRRHLWLDEEHFILNHPLWPDLQTRLSVKSMAGGRTTIHVGSPHGTGRVADDTPIDHHKFLVRSRDERERLLERYEAMQPGAGHNFAPFSVPERFSEHLQIGRV